MRTIHCVLAFAALAACGSEAERKAPIHAHAPGNAALGNAASAPAGVNAAPMEAMTEFGGGRVPLQVEACKAALALMTGAAPKDIEGEFVAGALAEVSRRSPEGGLRRILCRADTPSGLSWAAADAPGDAERIRWRSADRVTFGPSGESLKIVVSQGGTTREGDYPLAALRPDGK